MLRSVLAGMLALIGAEARGEEKPMAATVPAAPAVRLDDWKRPTYKPAELLAQAGPPKGPWTFVAMGDPHIAKDSNHARLAEQFAQIEKQSPVLVLLLGDIATETKRDGIASWETVFDKYGPSFQKRPWFFAVGNHDLQSPGLAEVYEKRIFAGPGKCGLPADSSFTDTRLYAADLKTGEQAWVLDTKRMVGGRMIAAGADLGLCFCALTGERVERTVAIKNGPDAGKPRLLADGDKNGVMIAVDIRTGQEKWRTEIGTHMTASGPVVADGVVYCGGDTEAMALRAADGKVLWRTPRSNHARPEKVIIPCPPAVVTRDLFVVAMDKTTEAFDRKDGSLRWSVKRDHDVGAMTMAAARHVVYTAASHSGIVQAIDSTNGKLLWEHILPENEAKECVSLLLMEGRLVVGSRSPSPRIYCLENGAAAKPPGAAKE